MSDAGRSGDWRDQLRQMGPVAGGFLLDVVDAATFGPLGLQWGLLLGAAAGWLLTAPYEMSSQRRFFLSSAAGVYCMLPFTAFLPLATVATALVRWLAPKPPAPPAEDAIEAEYRVDPEGPER